MQGETCSHYPSDLGMANVVVSQEPAVQHEWEG